MIGRAREYFVIANLGGAQLPQLLQGDRQIVDGLQRGRVKPDGRFVTFLAFGKLISDSQDAAQSVPSLCTIPIPRNRQTGRSRRGIQFSASPENFRVKAMEFRRSVCSRAGLGEESQGVIEISAMQCCKASFISSGSVRGRALLGCLVFLRIPKRRRAATPGTTAQMNREMVIITDAPAMGQEALTKRRLCLIHCHDRQRVQELSAQAGHPASTKVAQWRNCCKVETSGELTLSRYDRVYFGAVNQDYHAIFVMICRHQYFQICRSRFRQAFGPPGPKQA
jgi:hypothetical protein